jgi:outer membrane biogenesis lipoprotein LolB
MYDFSKIKQGALAALASVILTATAVGAAVGPAEAVQASPVYAAVQADGATNA